MLQRCRILRTSRCCKNDEYQGPRGVAEMMNTKSHEVFQRGCRDAEYDELRGVAELKNIKSCGA